MQQRWGIMALVAIMAIAGIGFVVGITDGVPRSLPDAPDRTIPDTVESDVLPAQSYAALRQGRVGANRDFGSRVEDLAPQGVQAAAADGDAAATGSKRLSLVQRSQGRAYEGAPPIIPHAVEQMSSDACRTCHQLGVQVGEALASRIPHQSLTECQQCHVAASPLEAPFTLAESMFQGNPAPLSGERAWEGAPPTMPHTTWMRDNCLACHGPQGKAGLQTTHPERVSCTQCHAPSAQLDQVLIGPQRLLADVDRPGAGSE